MPIHYKLTNVKNAALLKIGIQQRVLPNYRVPFFDRLAETFAGKVEVFAGEPRSQESIRCGKNLRIASLRRAKNLHIGHAKFYFCWQQGFISWLRTHRPDVLIVEANPRLLSNYIGIKVMKSWERPVIGWGLGILEWPAHNGWSAIRRDLHKMFYARFNALIAYSTKGARDYQSLGIPEERIFIAANAVSNENADRLFEKLKQKPESIKAWRARLGLSDSPTVLYVGRLTSPKRVDDLILACARVNDPAELLVVGDGSERPRLEALAKQVLPTARFLGHLEGEQLALCFAVSDLFVLPGSGGLAVQEAMAYGKPVVVASGDGTQVDLVREGKNGFHITPGDISDLTEAINKCINNRKLLRQMDQESRRIIQEEYNLDIMVESFLKAIDLVLR